MSSAAVGASRNPSFRDFPLGGVPRRAPPPRSRRRPGRPHARSVAGLAGVLVRAPAVPRASTASVRAARPRRASRVVRAQAGEPSRWVKRANGERADRYRGAASSPGAEGAPRGVANGARGFIAPKESAANDNDAVEDWSTGPKSSTASTTRTPSSPPSRCAPFSLFRRRRPWVFHRPARRARGVHPDPSREDSGRFPPRRAARRAGSRHAPAPTTRARPRPPPRRAAAVFPPRRPPHLALLCRVRHHSPTTAKKMNDKKIRPPRRPAPPRPSHVVRLTPPPPALPPIPPHPRNPPSSPDPSPVRLSRANSPTPSREISPRRRV